MRLCALGVIVFPPNSVSEWYLGEKGNARTGFSTAEGGSLAANETTNAHSLIPSPACFALLSSTTPSLLSVCLSLQQKHSLPSVGGWARRLQLPSLTPLTLNYTVQRREEGGKNQADLIYQKEDAWTVSKSPKQLEKRALEKRSSSAQSNEADMFFLAHTGCLRTVLSRGRMVMKRVCARLREFLWFWGVFFFGFFLVVIIKCEFIRRFTRHLIVRTVY